MEELYYIILYYIILYYIYLNSYSYGHSYAPLCVFKYAKGTLPLSPFSVITKGIALYCKGRPYGHRKGGHTVTARETHIHSSDRACNM